MFSSLLHLTEKYLSNKAVKHEVALIEFLSKQRF